jgi:DHA2 family methylenomycin A resistance protein-like MFS transporter
MSATGTAEVSEAAGRGPVLVAVTLGFAMVQLDVSVVNVAVKAIGASFGGGVSGLQWVVDGYTLTFAAFILSAGALGDRVGARRTLLAGFVLFTVASALCGAAPSVLFLVAARAVQGVGAAALGACSLALLNHTFAGVADRARAIRWWAVGGSIAMATGPVAGGVLIAAVGWRLIFFINVPAGAAGYWLAARYGRETPRAPGRGVDLPGQIAAVVALTALAGAVIEGGTRGFLAPLVVAGYGVAVVAGVVFVLLERRPVRVMLPLWLFRSRMFSVTACVGLLINVAFYGLYFSVSLYLQQVAGLSPLTTGLSFLPVLAGVGASNVLAGRIAASSGVRRALVLGAGLMGAGSGALLAAVSEPVWVAVLALTVTGAGIGLIVPVITAALMGSVDPSRSGIASGTLTALRQTGSVLGVALFGSLLGGFGLTGGLRVDCVVACGLAACAACLSLVLRGS